MSVPLPPDEQAERWEREDEQASERVVRFAERLRYRQLEARLERMMWTDCPKHGRSPRHPYDDGCFWCVDKIEPPPEGAP